MMKLSKDNALVLLSSEILVIRAAVTISENFAKVSYFLEWFSCFKICTILLEFIFILSQVLPYKKCTLLDKNKPNHMNFYFKI